NDETLERIEAHTMKYASSITCDRFYKLSQAILQVDLALQYIVSPTNAADTPKTLETVIQVTKRRSDEASQALDGIMTVIKLHSRVCAEAHELLSRLFFLFLGCVVSAAVFFELERGTECFVGHTCLWWHKNVLTPEMSEGLPTGKRILVQNTLLTIITDMLHSTWFSLVSFTTVGYGDLHPRTSLGKLVDIVGMIFSSCYTAMPLTLVGGQFYICYEVHSQEKRLQRVGTALLC
ncbi:Voltage-gated Ion Channel (VIC) Superfamily, partial [Phytophthora palmivora]